MPPTLMAEVDWQTVTTAVVGALGTVGGGIGIAIKFLLTYLRDGRREQRDHEEKIMLRVEAMVGKFDTTTREQSNVQRAESRETIQTLLKIQGETVEAVGGLSQRVNELGLAIGELRGEVARKQDRPSSGGRGERGHT